VGLGSSGDVNPLLGVASGLKERGHETTLISAPQFSSAAESVGADFSALGTAEAYDQIYADPDLWHPRRGLGVFFPYAAGLAAQTVDLLEKRHRPGETVVVATFQCFGARIANEALSIPLCTVLPNPILLQSVHDPNQNPIWNPPRWMGRTGVHWMYRVSNWEVSRHARSGVNAARRVRGLVSPIRDVVGWSQSSNLLLGLWPSLLSAPQADWPRQARTTGFVTHDGVAANSWRPPERLPNREDWLVFTPGTQMTHGSEFFRAAVAAADALEHPTLLVAKDASLVPDPLPENVWHVPYAPFEWLFERAAAVVHHGGIGTAGRALQAGLPQLIVPSGFDQFDNASRVTRIGAGRQLDRRKLTALSLAAAIRGLLDATDIRHRCAEIKAELGQADPLTETCVAIEGLMTGG
jgi:UDP:flavonoid glycosyltransferase YjiC (YdhE family)